MNTNRNTSAKTWAQRAAAVGIVGAVALTGAAAAQAHDNGSGQKRGSNPLSALVTAGTITAADAEAVKAALEADRDANKAEHQAEMKAARDAALASLVKAGTLTQSQADAIKATDVRGLRDLVRNGTLSMTDVMAIRDSLMAGRDESKTEHRAEMKAARDAALASLVKAGTLTQSQADAITSALDAAPQRGGKHGSGFGGKHGGGFDTKQGGRR